MTYKVKGWTDNFESAKSKLFKTRNQVYLPNKHGLGYKRLLAQDNGEALFGCWVAMCQVLSRQQPDREGYVTDDGKITGTPLLPSDIAMMTSFSETTASKMLSACSSQHIGWLEVVNVSPCQGLAKDLSGTCQGLNVPCEDLVKNPKPQFAGEGEGKGKGKGEGEEIDKDSTGELFPVEKLPEEPIETTNKHGDGRKDFELFWKEYPRKVDKQDALKAWLKAKDKPSVSEIVSKLAVHIATDTWQECIKNKTFKFIPHPATWINKRRWEAQVGSPSGSCSVTSPEQSYTQPASNQPVLYTCKSCSNQRLTRDDVAPATGLCDPEVPEEMMAERYVCLFCAKMISSGRAEDLDIKGLKYPLLVSESR